MRTIRINPYAVNSVNIGYQYDHNATIIQFENLNTDAPLYMKIQLDDTTYQAIPLLNNAFIVSSTYTQKKVAYKCQLVQKVDNEFIANSPKFELCVLASLPPSDIAKEVVPPNFKTAYDEIVETSQNIKNMAENGDFDGFSPSVELERELTGVKINVINKEGTSSEIVHDGKKGDRGEQGIQGIQGERGIQGIQGIQGVKGDKGNTGMTPNIEIGIVKTIDPDQPASIEKKGTTDNPIFDFYIPRGKDADITNLDKTLSIEGMAADAKAVGDKIEFIRNKSFDIALIGNKEGYTATTDDSADYYNKSISVYGETNQDTTTGVQLLEYPYETTDITTNGITFKTNADGSINVKGTSTAGINFYFKKNDTHKLPVGKYILSSASNVAGIQFVVGGLSSGIPFASGKTVTFEVTDSNIAIGHLLMQILSGVTINATIFPILNKGTTALPWEPFTGCAPSPNPDYPQTLKSKTLSEIKVTGANVFDVAKSQDNKYQNYDINTNNFSIVSNSSHWITGLIEVVEGETYTINKSHLGGCFYSDENTPIRTDVIKTAITKIVVPKKAKFINLNFTKAVTPFGTNIMFNKGASVLPWEPYKERKVTLSQPITLKGIFLQEGIDPINKSNIIINGKPYISDSIECINDDIQKIEHITERVYNGSETSWTSKIGKDEKSTIFTISEEIKLSYIPDQNTHILPSICNYFKNENLNILGDPAINCFKLDYRLFLEKLYYSFNVPIDVIPLMDINAWKEWLSTHNLKILFRGNIKYTSLPYEDQKAIKSMETFYSNTNVTADGAWINIEYVKDQKIVHDKIEKRLKALEGVALENV